MKSLAPGKPSAVITRATPAMRSNISQAINAHPTTLPPGADSATDRSSPASVAGPTVLTANAANSVPGVIGMSSVYCACPDVCSTADSFGSGSDTGYSLGSVVKLCVLDEIGRTNGTAAAWQPQSDLSSTGLSPNLTAHAGWRSAGTTSRTCTTASTQATVGMPHWPPPVAGLAQALVAAQPSHSTASRCCSDWTQQTSALSWLQAPHTALFRQTQTAACQSLHANDSINQ